MIIFINGSINSGKSTVAKILADKIGNAALVEVDQLRDFIGWMPLKDAIPLNLENTVSVIKNFAKNGLNVIIPYPLGQKNYKYLLDNLTQYQDQLRFFTLSPALEAALQNRGTRELTDWEKERIKYHYDIGISNPKFGIIIDNTAQTPQQTADEILNSL